MSAFFAHTENLFLAIISDEQPHVGELAQRSTKKARSEQREHAAEEQAVDGKCVASELNLECDDHTHIIKWSKVVVAKKPSIRTLPDKIIQKKYPNAKNVVFLKGSLRIDRLQRELLKQ